MGHELALVAVSPPIVQLEPQPRSSGVEPRAVQRQATWSHRTVPVCDVQTASSRDEGGVGDIHQSGIEWGKESGQLGIHVLRHYMPVVAAWVPATSAGIHKLNRLTALRLWL